VLCIHFDVTYSGNRDNIPSDARPLAPNESLLELIDYCFRKVNMMNLGRFNTFIDESNQVDLLKETSEQSLTRQECELGFRTAVSAFNSLRFISDSLSRLPLPAQTRLLNTHDMLMALVTLMETQFWIRRNDKVCFVCDNSALDQHLFSYIHVFSWVRFKNSKTPIGALSRPTSACLSPKPTRSCGC
jgi:hypothetical protein